MEGMSQFGIEYIYTWKCHNETPCIIKEIKMSCFQKWRTGR
jgi:hypothetical protein